MLYAHSKYESKLNGEFVLSKQNYHTVLWFNTVGD